MIRTKELFMKTNEISWDIEREYIIDQILKEEQEYFEYLQLKEDIEMNIDQSKIEIVNGKQTRIEVSQEREKGNRITEIFGS